MNYDVLYEADAAITAAHQAFAVKLLGPFSANVDSTRAAQLVNMGLLTDKQATSGILVPGVEIDPFLFAVLIGSITAEESLSPHPIYKSWKSSIAQGAKSIVGWAKTIAQKVTKRAKIFSSRPKGVPEFLTDSEIHAWMYAKERAGEYITKASTELKARVRELTVEAIENGWTKEKFTAKLEDEFGKQTRNWATVARTELQTAFNEGVAAHSVDQHGSNAQIAFLPEPDACKKCKEKFLDSEGKPIVFLVTQYKASNGGSLLPPHPNCRCRPVSVPPGGKVSEDWQLTKSVNITLDNLVYGGNN